MDVTTCKWILCSYLVSFMRLFAATVDWAERAWEIAHRLHLQLLIPPTSLCTLLCTLFFCFRLSAVEVDAIEVGAAKFGDEWNPDEVDGKFGGGNTSEVDAAGVSIASPGVELLTALGTMNAWSL